MTLAAVALGSNLGDRLGNLRAGLAGLRQLGEVVGISSLYETAPVGGPDQGPYLNAVVTLRTDLGPSELLSGMQQIELEAGRERLVRWGPRTLDLDLITFGDEVINTGNLIVPHPRAPERRFVLEPLAEVLPEARVDSGTANGLLAGVRRQRVVRVADVWAADLAFAASGRPWIVGQMLLGVVWAVVLVTTGDLDPGWLARVIGLLLAAGGFGVLAGAIRALGSAMTVDPIPRQASMATGGPFRFLRHPTYAGVVALLLGLSIAFGSWEAAVVAVGFALFFDLKARTEERYLRILYPEYADYAGRVRGRLIPGLP
ncbi:MAG TPA: 2-amino-4-hydroxy-6-hydroxymethyldihydropteridine diphosphokinase [Acidimicrobiia bacterium]